MYAVDAIVRPYDDWKRLMIAHVHTQGDAHQTIRGLPELRALLPTSCMQVLSPTFIVHLRRCSDGGGNFLCSYAFNLGDVSPEIWSEITTVRLFIQTACFQDPRQNGSFSHERTIC